MPSASQTRSSAGLVTESFQRCSSSGPMLAMPTMGLRPKVARNSFAFFPFAHGAISPRRDCRSANSVGASWLMVVMSIEVIDPPPELAMKRVSGLILRISPSHRRHSSNSRPSLHSTHLR